MSITPHNSSYLDVITVQHSLNLALFQPFYVHLHEISLLCYYDVSSLVTPSI